jgi:ribosomal protein S20
MANMKNAKKKIKTIAKAKETNNVYKSSMKTAIKNVETAVANKDADSAKEALLVAIKRIDKAGAKGIAHSNFVARNKSRLTKKVNEMK